MSANDYLSVSVRAPTATLADGLSTALYVAPLDRAQAILDRFGDVGALMILRDGSHICYNLG